MRCVVTGSGGQLGRCLTRRLRESEVHALSAALGRGECDIASEADVDRLFTQGAGADAEVVFNAAAYTAVDRCETDVETAHAVNAVGAGLLARRCQERNILLVHVSTDYVFAGDARVPYAVDAEPSPRSAYGRTKLAGERAVLEACDRHLVVRTSWVFGPGRNFVAAILEQARKRRSGEQEGPLRVVDDQEGSPTYADHLAAGLVALAERALDDRTLPAEPSNRRGEPVRGLYHLTGAGRTTWWGFARRILDRTGHADLEIHRMKTASLDLAAPRPAYSVLDVGRAAALGIRLPSWEQGLDDHLASPEGAAQLEGAT